MKSPFKINLKGIGLLLSCQMIYGSSIAQIVTIDGVALSIASGTSVTIEAGLTNQTNGTTDGTIDNDGTITLTGDWNNNATQGGVVSANLDATGSIEFIGSAAQALGGTASTTFENLTINNTSSTGVTLDEPITISTSLTLTDGILFSDATNFPTLNDNVTSSSGSDASHVDGPIRKIGDEAFTFPTGDQGVWARIGISLPAGSSTFTAEYNFAAFSDLTTDLSLDRASALEYWNLTRNSGSDVTVTLFYEDAARSEITDFTNADLVAARFDGADWISVGTAAIPSNPSGSVISSSQSTFGNFTFGSVNGNNPLPVTLSTFNASLVDGHALLKWTTVQELNNDFFEVERSINGIDFLSIAQIPGRGNSSVPTDYEYLDQQFPKVLTYYRLNQVDFDGRNERSPTIILDPTKTTGLLVKIHGNPTASNQILFSILEASLDLPIGIYLHDIEGEEIHRQLINPVRRDQSLRLGFPLESGIYLLSVEQGRFRIQEKIVVGD